MRKVLWMAVLTLSLAAGVPAVTSRAADPAKGKDVTAVLMDRKLKEAQKALQGLALNDFTKIAAAADELIDVSKAAEWRVLKGPQYELFSNEFRRRAAQMGRAARDKNLDGATLAYVEMTMTCVRCHQHVREERRTEVDPIPTDVRRAAAE